MVDEKFVETLERLGFRDAVKHVPSIIQQIELVDTKGIIKRYYPGNDIEDDRLSFYYSLAAIIYEERKRQ